MCFFMSRFFFCRSMLLGRGCPILPMPHAALPGIVHEGGLEVPVPAPLVGFTAFWRPLLAAAADGAQQPQLRWVPCWRLAGWAQRAENAIMHFGTGCQNKIVNALLDVLLFKTWVSPIHPGWLPPGPQKIGSFEGNCQNIFHT